MTEFLALLTVLYICEASAEMRLLSPGEAAGCSSTYESVKAHFIDEADPALPGTPDRYRQNTTAYLAFKRWESENAALVSELKRAARSRVRETPARIHQFG